MADSSDIHYKVLVAVAVCMFAVLWVVLPRLWSLLREGVKERRREACQGTEEKDDLSDEESSGIRVDNMADSSGKNISHVKNMAKIYEQRICDAPSPGHSDGRKERYPRGQGGRTSGKENGKGNCGNAPAHSMEGKTKESGGKDGMSTKTDSENKGEEDNANETEMSADGVHGAESGKRTDENVTGKQTQVSTKAKSGQGEESEEDQGIEEVNGGDTGRLDLEEKEGDGGTAEQGRKDDEGRREGNSSETSSALALEEHSDEVLNPATVPGDVKRAISGEDEGTMDEEEMKASEAVKEKSVKKANTDSEAKEADNKMSTAEHSGQNTEENPDETQVTENANSTQGEGSDEDHGSEVAEDGNYEMMSPGENEGGEEDEQGGNNDEMRLEETKPSTSTSGDGDHHPATVKDENHKQSGEGGGTKDKVHVVKQVNVELPNGKEKLQRGEDTSPLVERGRDTESSGSLADREQAELEDSSEDGPSAESVDKTADGDGTKVAERIDKMTENDQVRNETDAKPSDEKEITNKKGTEKRAFRSIKVTIMTSLQESTISGLVKELQELKNEKISSVSVLELPYSGLEYYRFEEPVEFMILCHSIHNRRFGLTDVPDSLYDDFLPYCEKKIGKDNIVVIAHDFDDSDTTREIRMKKFRYEQPTTFRTAGLVLLSGKLGGPCQVAEEDWKRLTNFIYEATKLPQEKSTQQQISTSLPEVSPSQPTPIQDKGPASNQEPTDNVARRKDDEPSDKTTSVSPSDAPSGDLLHLRSEEETASARRGTVPCPNVIHVCTSSTEESVSGLIARLSSTKSKKEFEARFLKLPHIRLNDFKFEESTVKSNHGMVLCHSYNNGGLTVTDLDGALYDKYLQYCSSFFGKERVAVIVHDMTFPIKAGKILMSRFRKDQPTASKLSQPIVFSGSLADDKNLEMSDEDWKSMQQYLEMI